MGYKMAAVEVEVELYDEDSFEDMLNETYGTVDVCGYSYDAGYLLKKLDPIAFNCSLNDFQEYETRYQCPICGEEFEDEDDALDCCPENTIDDDEDEADDEEEAE